jgi:hypothetical protein
MAARTVQVEVRHDWVDRVYPACPAARLFARLTGKRTFSSGDLQAIRELGYTITMAPGKPSLPDGYGEFETVPG